MDCILCAWQGIKQLKKAEAFPAGYLKFCALPVQKYIDYQAKSRVNSSLAEMQNDATLSYCHSDLSLELKQALDKLQPDEKDIVLLCLVAGFTSKECSKIVGIKRRVSGQSFQEALRK